jgi:hypothetical protein
VLFEKFFNSQNSTKVEEKSPDFKKYIYSFLSNLAKSSCVDDASLSLGCLHITKTKWTSAFGEDFQ